MALSSSNAARQLSDGNSQGTVLGQSATDLVGFYGATPVAQQAVGSEIATTAAVPSTSSTGFAFATSAQANAALNAIADIQAALKNLGLSS